ncbi:MAG: hypothetical protein QHC89_21505 [Bosea sp. (in: a-proteobacteria)]|nr:hypothetical protein [Bosea sp. (in: a-proteobacteria)]
MDARRFRSASGILQSGNNLGSIELVVPGDKDDGPLSQRAAPLKVDPLDRTRDRAVNVAREHRDIELPDVMRKLKRAELAMDIRQHQEPHTYSNVPGKIKIELLSLFGQESYLVGLRRFPRGVFG